jgi:hypothetical protein
MALFGKKTQSAPIQASKGPEKVAPENSYLGREPIIDRDQAIIGYELFFRPGTTLKAKRVNERNEVLAQIAKRLEADPKAEVTYPDEITDANLRDDEGNEVKEVTLGEMLYALKTKGVAKELKDRPVIKAALEQAKTQKMTKQDLEKLVFAFVMI